MTFTKKPAVTTLVLLLPAVSVAIDKSADVKVTPLLKTTRSWDGERLVYPKGQAEITGFLVEIAPGGETGWHEHPVPSFGMVLEGTLSVDLEGGQVKYLQAGDVVAEVVNTQHNGHNMGDEPVKIIVFYAGSVGQTLTVGSANSKRPDP